MFVLPPQGARGISVLVASGDNGSGGAWREPCHGRFQPTFPSAVPWVTAVGGTAARAHARSRRAAKTLEFGRKGFTEVAHPQYVDVYVLILILTARSLARRLP